MQALFTTQSYARILSSFFLFFAISSSRAWSADSGAEKIESLTIENAVAQGIKANLDLMAAKLNISQAEADALTAGEYSNPSVQFDTVFQPLNGTNWNQTNAGGPKQYDLIFSYPFDFSGKRSASENSAKQAVKVSEAAFQDSVRLKVREIRLAYFDLLVADQQLTLAHEKEDRLRHLVEVLERRIGQKQILPLLLLRAQLARDQAKLDLEQREITLRAAETNLSVLLGYSEGTKVAPASKLRDFKLMEFPSKAELMAKALEQRPDYNALRLTMKKAGLDRKLADAQVWDNFALTFGVSSQGPVDGNSTGAGSLGQAYSWNFGINVPLPTFNRNQGNIQKTAVIEEQASKQMASLQLSITQEIGTLYDQLNAGKHLLEAYESKQLKQAREVRDAQSRLFGTGSSALLDYFDGINAYVGTYAAYYDAVAEYRRNLARLNSALGKDQL